jgi:hypothetical protein
LGAPKQWRRKRYGRYGAVAMPIPNIGGRRHTKADGQTKSDMSSLAYSIKNFSLQMRRSLYPQYVDSNDVIMWVYISIGLIAAIS